MEIDGPHVRADLCTHKQEAKTAMHTFQRLQKALLATLAVTTFFVLPTQDLMASSPRFMVISMFNNDLQIATDDNDHDLSVSFALVGNQTHVHVFYGSNTKLAIYGNHIDSYSYGANVRSFVIQGRIDDVRIYLGDGDDQFFMRDYRPTWNSHGVIDVETGGGNNVVELQSGYCRSLEILGGRHDDAVFAREPIDERTTR